MSDWLSPNPPRITDPLCFMKNEKLNRLNKNNTPRRKRLKRKNRLESAKKWMLQYTGKNIVKGYSNWFGVDLICSIKELRMNGVIIDENYEKQVLISKESKTSAKRLDSKNTDEHTDSNFVFIAGYTSGGAPYGILHEELFNDEKSNKLSDLNLQPHEK